MKILNFITRKHVSNERMKLLLDKVLVRFACSACICLCESCKSLYDSCDFTYTEYSDVVHYIYEHRPKSAKSVVLKSDLWCTSYFWDKYDPASRILFLRNLINKL